LILFILFAGLTLLVITRFSNLEQIGTQASTGDPWWITAAILIHVFYYLSTTLVYYLSFKTVGVSLRIPGLVPAMLASLFVNTVLPTGGVGGIAVMADYAASQGASASRATVAVLLSLVVDLFTLVPFVILGIVYLALQNQAYFYEWLGFVFFLIFIFGLIILLLLARKKETWVRNIFTWMRRIANQVGSWVKRPNLIKEAWVDNNANEFIEGSAMIARNPRIMAINLVWGFFTHVFNLASLYAFCVAFNQAINFGTLVAAFSLGIVFFIITIIPQGVGAVEGIMGLVMVDMGVSRSGAAVITLAFRGVDFWLPVILGFISYYYITQKARKRKLKETAAIGETNL
jgi:glycosyltransferase 2 family protein